MRYFINEIIPDLSMNVDFSSLMMPFGLVIVECSEQEKKEVCNVSSYFVTYVSCSLIASYREKCFKIGQKETRT